MFITLETKLDDVPVTIKGQFDADGDFDFESVLCAGHDIYDHLGEHTINYLDCAVHAHAAKLAEEQQS